MTLSINFEFRKQFSHLNHTLSYCYQCATCSGGCPVAKLTKGEYNPRKIIECALLGLEEKLIQQQEPNVWLCVTCQKCVELCPQGVELTEIFDIIKNYCVKSGKLPDAFKSQAELVYNTGVALPFTEPILKRRTALGLGTIKNADPLEIQTLLQTIDFDKTISIGSAEQKEGDEN
jgi:heterodisulfide reductase subunit C